MARRTERQATFLRAKVIGLDDVVLNCQVVDISESGARLYVKDAKVPNDFLLSIPSRGQSFFCERARRDGDFIGVRFVTKGHLR